MKIFNRFLSLGLFAFALYELFTWADKTGLGIILAIILGCLGYVVWTLPLTSDASNDSKGDRLVKFDRAKFNKGLVVGAKALIFGLLVVGAAFGFDEFNKGIYAKSLTITNAHYQKNLNCTDKPQNGVVWDFLLPSCEGKQMEIIATIHNGGQYTLHSVRGKIVFLKDGKPYATTSEVWVTTGSITRGTDFKSTINDANMDEVRAIDNGTHLGWLRDFMNAQTPFEIKIETAVRN